MHGTIIHVPLLHSVVPAHLHITPIRHSTASRRTWEPTSMLMLLSNLLRFARGPLLFNMDLVSWPAQTKSFELLKLMLKLRQLWLSITECVYTCTQLRLSTLPFFMHNKFKKELYHIVLINKNKQTKQNQTRKF